MPAKEMSFVCGRESISWESGLRSFRVIQRFKWGPDRALALFKAGYGYSSIDHPMNLVREIWSAKGSRESKYTHEESLGFLKSEVRESTRQDLRYTGDL